MTMFGTRQRQNQCHLDTRCHERVSTSTSPEILVSDAVHTVSTIGFKYTHNEHQHRFGYDALLSCDMKRMSKVMTSLTVEAGEAVPRTLWLRYNPHTWHVDGVLRSMPKASREKWLCAYLATLTLDAAPLAIGYAFYDTSDGVLDVIRNDEFHAAFVEVTMDLTAACHDQE